MDDPRSSRPLVFREPPLPGCEARPVFAFLAKRYCDVTLRELAPHVGVGRPDCVPHLVSRAVAAVPDSAIGRALARLEQQLQHT